VDQHHAHSDFDYVQCVTLTPKSVPGQGFGDEDQNPRIAVSADTPQHYPPKTAQPNVVDGPFTTFPSVVDGPSTTL
jgi:hypothetical protein